MVPCWPFPEPLMDTGISNRSMMSFCKTYWF
jgi:hypothetical protein